MKAGVNMFFIYRSYQYSIGATLLNMFFRLLALGCIGGFCLCLEPFIEDGSVTMKELQMNIPLIALGIGLLVAAAVILIKHNKITDKYAEKRVSKKLVSKPGFAYRYVRDNPNLYDSVCAGNPKFAEKYTKNEDGIIVKRK